MSHQWNLWDFRRTAALSSRDHHLNFAQFATGGGLFSEIILLNLDSGVDADVEVSFRGDQGTPLAFQLGQDSVNGDLQLSIPPSGMRILQTDGSGADSRRMC